MTSPTPKNEKNNTRQPSETSVVFGKNGVAEILTHHPKRVLKVFIAHEQSSHRRLKQLADQAYELGIPCQTKPRQKLDLLSEGEFHQGIVAVVAAKPVWSLQDLIAHLQQKPKETPALVLALDGVTDAHNTGAIIRVATAAGVDAIVVPKVGSANLSPVVSKISAGTDTLINWVMVPNLANAMSTLKDQGLWWVGTAVDPSAKIYYDYRDYTVPTGIVMGAEEKGLRPIIEKQCDQLVYIPMAEGINSLNVSVATGVILFEALRQRQQSR